MRKYLKFLPIAVIIGGLIFWKITSQEAFSLSNLLADIRNLGWVGMLYFVGLYIVATVMLIPGSVITLAAGFIYGLWIGTALVSVGSVVGATLAFLLSRTILHDWVQQKTQNFPKWKAVQSVIEKNGLKMIMLLRLTPVFPFSLLNYFLGVTRMKWHHYILGSWVAMLPGTFLYVYLGSIAKSINQIIQGETQSSPAQKILLGVGLLVTLYIVVWVTRKAKKELEIETQKAQKA